MFYVKLLSKVTRLCARVIQYSDWYSVLCCNQAMKDRGQTISIESIKMAQLIGVVSSDAARVKHGITELW